MAGGHYPDIVSMAVSRAQSGLLTAPRPTSSSAFAVFCALELLDLAALAVNLRTHAFHLAADERRTESYEILDALISAFKNSVTTISALTVARTAAARSDGLVCSSLQAFDFGLSVSRLQSLRLWFQLRRHPHPHGITKSDRSPFVQ